MNINVAVIASIIIAMFILLVSCIIALQCQVATLHRLLQETTREYKLYQAMVDKDFKTAGVLRNLCAGVKDKSVSPQPEEKREIEPAATITQFG